MRGRLREDISSCDAGKEHFWCVSGVGPLHVLVAKILRYQRIRRHVSWDNTCMACRPILPQLVRHAVSLPQAQLTTLHSCSLIGNCLPCWARRRGVFTMAGSCSTPSLVGGKVSLVMTDPLCGRLSQYVPMTLSHSGFLNRFCNSTSAFSCMRIMPFR